MIKYPNIRQHYMPIQPTIDQHGTDVVYHEFGPDIPLQHFIYCYWQLKTVRPLSEPFIYRVVADGCIDILLELDQPENSFVTGLSTSYIEFPLAPSFNYVGVRFLPAAFPQFFKIDASELTNRFETLDEIETKTPLYLRDRLSDRLNLKQIEDILNNYFLKRLAQIDFKVDARFYNALEVVLKNRGNLSVETDLDIGLSPRQLRRLFNFYVGDTSKIFSKIVRFQNVLYSKPSNQSLSKNGLFYSLGYYDQSHFIKEFKTYFGKSPGKAFKD